MKVVCFALVLVVQMEFQLVVVQMSLGCKTRSAAFIFAKVGFFASVKAEMGFEVTFFKKAFTAICHGAVKLTLAQVFLVVNLKALGSAVRLVTTLEAAFEGFMLLVGFLVVFKVTSRHEGFIASGVQTGKRFVP